MKKNMLQRVVVAGTQAGPWAGKLGLDVLRAEVGRFCDGELEVRVGSELAGKVAVVVQSGAAPVHESLMELLLLIDACWRGGAVGVEAVVPYMPYNRQDRARDGVALSAEVVAGMLEVVGLDALTTVTLHSGRGVDFFDIPVRELDGLAAFVPVVAEALRGEDVVVVAPDAGAAERGERVAVALGEMWGVRVPLAVVDKRRDDDNVIQGVDIAGNWAGKHTLIVDDMIDTAGTLVAVSEALRAAGVEAVSVAAVHGVFSGPAVRRVMGLGLANLWVGDTLPLPDGVRAVVVEIKL